MAQSKFAELAVECFGVRFGLGAVVQQIRHFGDVRLIAHQAGELRQQLVRHHIQHGVQRCHVGYTTAVQADVDFDVQTHGFGLRAGKL